MSIRHMQFNGQVVSRGKRSQIWNYTLIFFTEIHFLLIADILLSLSIAQWSNLTSQTNSFFRLLIREFQPLSKLVTLGERLCPRALGLAWSKPDAEFIVYLSTQLQIHILQANVNALWWWGFCFRCSATRMIIPMEFRSSSKGAHSASSSIAF